MCQTREESEAALDPTNAHIIKTICPNFTKRIARVETYHSHLLEIEDGKVHEYARLLDLVKQQLWFNLVVDTSYDMWLRPRWGDSHERRYVKWLVNQKTQCWDVTQYIMTWVSVPMHQLLEHDVTVSSTTFALNHNRPWGLAYQKPEVCVTRSSYTTFSPPFEVRCAWMAAVAALWWGAPERLRGTPCTINRFIGTGEEVKATDAVYDAAYNAAYNAAYDTAYASGVLIGGLACILLVTVALLAHAIGQTTAAKRQFWAEKALVGAYSATLVLFLYGCVYM